MPQRATRANEVWCVDSCFDWCLNGTKLKVLSVVAEFTRECLALEAATSFKSLGVQRVLFELFASRLAPKYHRSDNGTEVISRSLAVFLSQTGTESRFIKPGSPWQSAFVERFNSTLLRDCLDVQEFYNLADSQVKLRIFKRYYNEERPQSSLGNSPPAVAMSSSEGDYP